MFTQDSLFNFNGMRSMRVLLFLRNTYADSLTGGLLIISSHALTAGDDGLTGLVDRLLEGVWEGCWWYSISGLEAKSCKSIGFVLFLSASATVLLLSLIAGVISWCCCCRGFPSRRFLLAVVGLISYRSLLLPRGLDRSPLLLVVVIGDEDSTIGSVAAGFLIIVDDEDGWRTVASKGAVGRKLE